MKHKITLLLLPLHSSHYTQPLDVAVFSPLSTALGQEVDRFSSIGISRIRKVEWLELYIKARQKAITSKNISSAWRGAGLIPLNRKKVLRHLPISTSPLLSPLSQPEAILQAITSSPPNSTALRAANTAFNASITGGNPLDTPARKYAKSLTKATERLAAQVAILRKERIDQEKVLGNRKQRCRNWKMAKDFFAI